MSPSRGIRSGGGGARLDNMSDIVNSFSAWLTSQDPLFVMLVVTLMAGAESMLGLGYLVPGEVSVVLGAALLVEHEVALLLWVLVGTAAFLGDLTSWWIGRRVGPGLRAGRLVARVGVGRWDSTAASVRRYGVGAVVTARFLPVVRALTPAVAGASGMRPSRFAPAAAVGAAAQSALLVGIGTLAGESWPQVQDRVGLVGWVLLGVLVVAVGARVLAPRLRRAVR